MADTDYPLLVFPDPVPAKRTKRTSRGRKIESPIRREQANRLAPQFQRLQEAMENRRLELQDNPHGLVPEQVLVVETTGTVENFIRAVE